MIFELGPNEQNVSALRELLDMDAGHLSRMLTRLERQDLVARRRSERDGRRQVVKLTAAGRRTLAALDARSTEEVRRLLRPLGPGERRRLAASMGAIHSILEPGVGAEARVRIRAPRAGDLGWIVEANGRAYWEEFSWDREFETLVAGIVADFAANHEAGREAAFIAELDGARAGCVLCVRHDQHTAKLRLLLVEPWARGHRIGERLVDRCMRFARSAGYERMTLWTNHPLTAARRIYDQRGFTLVAEEPHRSFGHDLVGQTLERDL